MFIIIIIKDTLETQDFCTGCYKSTKKIFIS